MNTGWTLEKKKGNCHRNGLLKLFSVFFLPFMDTRDAIKASSPAPDSVISQMFMGTEIPVLHLLGCCSSELSRGVPLSGRAKSWNKGWFWQKPSEGTG